MKREHSRTKVLRSVVGVAVPAMVLLSGCPGQCSPAAAPSQEPQAQPAAGAEPGAPVSPSVTGAQFSEDFATPGSFDARFTHGWSGEVQAGALFQGNINDWQGDHDGMCGDPLATHRTIHVTPPANEAGAPGNSVKNVDQAFYQCAPGGNNANAHLMTSVNTEGYAIAWFTPNQTFDNVHQVCWDQNFTHLGGGKWTTVTFLTPAEYSGKTDLGYNDPDFADLNGPHVPNGVAQFGVETGKGEIRTWQNGRFVGDAPGLDLAADHATRLPTCVVDNENGTVTVTQGALPAQTIAGQIPNGTIRLVWNDDNYNPDKHFSTAVEDHSANLPADPRLTWHWDNIEIS